LSGTTNPAMDTSPTTDANKTVIMRSAGTFNGTTKTIEVVVQRVALPPFPGAVNIPGRHSDSVVSSDGIDFDGRDYACAASGTGCDAAANWTVTTNPLKYGMATQPGIQAGGGATFEANVEAALDRTAKRNAIKGKSQSTGTYATGLDTVAADSSLTPALLDDFVNHVASNPATTVLRSTAGCPMVVAGSASGLTNAPGLTNGCGVNTTVNLGSRQDPKLVFFRGDAGSGAAGLTVHRGIKGAGILVVQDGALNNHGSLEWDGLVIVTGQSTSMGFMASSDTIIIRGAAVASESNAGAAFGSFDFSVDGAIRGLSIRSSQQNVDMVQSMRSLHSITNWREI
jgi:hypothetical protein